MEKPRYLNYEIRVVQAGSGYVYRHIWHWVQSQTAGVGRCQSQLGREDDEWMVMMMHESQSCIG